jgi:hypothetical protein
MQDDPNVDTSSTAQRGRVVEVTGAVSASVGVTASILGSVEKNVSVAVRGYVKSLRRLEDAATDEHRPDDVYIALAETTNWLNSISSFSKLRGTIHGRHLVEGVSFARDRMQHQWASVTYRDHEGAWVWRPAEQLPPPDDSANSGAKKEPFYTAHLADRPILDVLRQLEPMIRALLTSTSG